MKAILRFTALFLLLLSAAGLAGAQPTPRPAHPSYHNTIRLDVAGMLLRNAGAVVFGDPFTLPLLVGYERQLGQRTSANVEVLLNGGDGGEPKMAGLALQGRYYFYQQRYRGPVGFYIAPTLSFRRAEEPYRYGSARQRQQLGGGGALLGVQLPLGQQGRLVLDAALGVMNWQRLDAVESTNYGAYYQTYYEIHGTVADGRLSLGYRF
ncbi:hypothetical protein CDA63_02845 [Hymenobacter amundsenii]|uniref:DUF3575 domain-containing protein n=1 Tax=Hymenobacter amundsenii TaxID=2006685 RepID=A0A246FPN9_9BACT|nr:hypothetical protein [Hymenobacter amundsenii]OWP64713.1 hypothetical protein CDA63_02845 [Hymenobacter amundsenii]